MLDLNRMRVLLRVIELGSMTAAAESLYNSPSAISQQLRKLETEVGQPLLHRRTDGIVPTDAGNILAAHARSILRQMDAAESDLRRLAGLDGGSVSVGTFPTLGSSFLPLAISRFRKENPSITVEVRSSRIEGLIDMLARGDIGLALLWEYDWSPLDPRQFELTRVFEEPTVLLVARDHPLADRTTVRMREFGDEPWIIRADDHPVAELLQRTCTAAGFTPRIAFRANDYLEAQAMVSAGIGIALAPHSAVVTRHPGVRALGLGGDAPQRRVLLAQRRDRLRAPAEVAFQNVVLDLGSRWPEDSPDQGPGPHASGRAK
ncbi:LysR family transcriptional regulator [Microbacterium sp. LWH3-1.2]|uniref:LysR family transcriptional regulator n=1 Tax=Microbacterium sp. LWH3-1.2 TaxID=3135256 RepID=UPI00341875FF